MNVNERLENIANAIHAANKINSTYKPEKNNNLKTRLLPANVDVLKNILGIIAEYSPKRHRSKISNTLERTSHFSTTFRDLKHYMSSSRSDSGYRKSFIDILSILEPIADVRKKNIIQKILKLDEILHN